MSDSVKLTERHLSELRACERRPGIWAKVPPAIADRDLVLYLEQGLVHWRGLDRGYEITPAGRAALTKDRYDAR